MITPTINTQSKIEIQIGDNTHSQDHAITLVSFKMINTIVNKPGNFIPDDDDDELLIIFDFNLNYLILFPL